MRDDFINGYYYWQNLDFYFPLVPNFVCELHIFILFALHCIYLDVLRCLYFIVISDHLCATYLNVLIVDPSASTHFPSREFVEVSIDMFHVFVLAYPRPNSYFVTPLSLMTSHSGNGLSKKCPGDLEKIPSLSLGHGTWETPISPPIFSSPTAYI